MGDIRSRTEESSFATSQDKINVHQGEKCYNSINSEENTSTVQDEPYENFADVKRNIVLFCLGFLLLYTAYDSARFIQSSLHQKNGAGVLGLGSGYLTSVVVFLILPSLIISKLGHKWTMVSCSIGYIAFAAVNFMETTSVIIIGNIILGATRAPLRVATCSFYAQLCIRYAKFKKEPNIIVMNRLLGIQHFVTDSSNIIGPLLLSLIITRSDEQQQFIRNSDDILLCVSNGEQYYKNSSTQSLIERPTYNQIYTLCGTWIVLAVLGFVALLFLNGNKFDISYNNEKTTIVKLLLDTVSHFQESTPLKLLMPIGLFSGISVSFFTADFAKSFVGCVAGVSHIGNVTMVYGIFSTLGSVALGHLVTYLGQRVCLSIGFLAHFSALLILLFWKPNVEEQYVLYVVAGLAGFSNNGISTQVIAIYGSIFQDRKDAAFSNWHVFQCSGMMMSFFYSPYLLTDTKLYILLAFLVASAVGYYTIEYMERDKNGQNLCDSDNP